MTSTDAQGFSEEMLRLEAVFGRAGAEETEVRAEAYFEALAAFDLAEVRRAVRLAVQRASWFPKPAELIAFIAEARHTSHQLAATEQRALAAAQAVPHEVAAGFIRQVIARLTTRFGPRSEFDTPKAWSDADIKGLHDANAVAKATDPVHQARVAEARRRLEDA